jgi:2,4-dienoyl-CoA reductase-like NADH-dependent reductase (Old Yellow Enzyme family)
VRGEGFIGVQVHADPGSLSTCALFPHTNRCTGHYCSFAQGRACTLAEILDGEEGRFGSFPILVKMNRTDVVKRGIEIDTFSDLVGEIARDGVTTIEIGGSTWECPIRTEEELGLRAVPAPESRTGLHIPGPELLPHVR